MKGDSVFGAIMPYLIMAGLVVISIYAGLTADACIAIVFCLIGGALAGGYVSSLIFDRLDGKIKKMRYVFFPLFLLFTCILFLVAVHFTDLEVFEHRETNSVGNASPRSYQTRSGSSSNDIKSIYQEYYPMVWGYIAKYSSSPESYIKYYHQVWGDLQRYTGDGMNFDTLTQYEQSLVNYPTLGAYIYFATNNSKEYHSTTKCYTLLRSNPIKRPLSQRYYYDPCSKCVGE